MIVYTSTSNLQLRRDECYGHTHAFPPILIIVVTDRSIVRNGNAQSIISRLDDHLTVREDLLDHRLRISQVTSFVWEDSTRNGSVFASREQCTVMPLRDSGAWDSSSVSGMIRVRRSRFIWAGIDTRDVQGTVPPNIGKPPDSGLRLPLLWCLERSLDVSYCVFSFAAPFSSGL